MPVEVEVDADGFRPGPGRAYGSIDLRRLERAVAAALVDTLGALEVDVEAEGPLALTLGVVDCARLAEVLRTSGGADGSPRCLAIQAGVGGGGGIWALYTMCTHCPLGRGCGSVERSARWSV